MLEGDSRFRLRTDRHVVRNQPISVSNTLSSGLHSPAMLHCWDTVCSTTQQPSVVSYSENFGVLTVIKCWNNKNNNNGIHFTISYGLQFAKSQFVSLFSVNVLDKPYLYHLITSQWALMSEKSWQPLSQSENSLLLYFKVTSNSILLPRLLKYLAEMLLSVLQTYADIVLALSTLD